ncbi:hypothetical protein MMC12_008679 [Toensbergia leucococca]|nr:hypothetical protein [Toensbergia leucococca]
MCTYIHYHFIACLHRTTGAPIWCPARMQQAPDGSWEAGVCTDGREWVAQSAADKSAANKNDKAPFTAHSSREEAGNGQGATGGGRKGTGGQERK